MEGCGVYGMVELHRCTYVSIQDNEQINLTDSMLRKKLKELCISLYTGWRGGLLETVFFCCC